MGFGFNPFTGNFDLDTKPGVTLYDGCIPAGTQAIVDTIPNDEFTLVNYNMSVGSEANGVLKSLDIRVTNLLGNYSEIRSNLVIVGGADIPIYTSNTATIQYGDAGLLYGNVGLTYGLVLAPGGNFELVIQNNHAFEICYQFAKLQLDV